MACSAPPEVVGSAVATAVDVTANASAAAKIAARMNPLYVAVQCHVDRSADDDRDQSALPAFTHPERSGLRLRIANAGDDALVERCASHAVDYHVVALVLEEPDLLIGIALLSGFRH